MLRFVLFIAVSALALALDAPVNDGRIVGGVNTTIEEYPHHLALEFTERRWCGASLIHPNIAITAGHCVYERQDDLFRVRAGFTNYEDEGEIANVIQICTHPKYQKRKDYDISVLLLNRSLPLSDKIQTIHLQPVGVEIEDGTIGTVTGWGRLVSGGELPSALQKVDVPKVNYDVCVQNIPTDNITARMDCYGYTEGGHDACQGDSGGPIVSNGRQVGISSWGKGCARPNKPGVYVKISNEEITEHINNCTERFAQYI